MDCKLTKRDYHFNAFPISNRANAIANRISEYKNNPKPKNEELPF